ncbi:MAG: hypothetical protein WBB68_01120 [Candidatus Moraniibacteriota bacterium]
MNHKPLFLATALIALLVIAGAFWCIQNRPPMAVNQPVVTNPVVETPVQVEPQAEPGVNPDTYPQHIETIPGNADEVWYNIPELGIRMKLNREFAEDLVYRVVYSKILSGEERRAAYFETKAMMRIDIYCSPENGGSGALSRNEGIAQEVARTSEFIKSRLKNIIQIGESYYLFERPQATCWDPGHSEEVMKLDPNTMYAGKGARHVSDGYKSIQLIPGEE